MVRKDVKLRVQLGAAKSLKIKRQISIKGVNLCSYIGFDNIGT